MPISRKSPQPPLLFLGCLLAGWGLGKLHPLALGLPATVRMASGVLLLVLAALHGGWGLLTFKRMGTTPEPNGEATALLTSGPFRWSRNPLYLGLAILLVGLGI